MRVTWRQRLEQQPALWRFSEWPVIPREAVAKTARKAYLRNQQIAAAVLAGQPLKAVARAHGVTAARVTQLLERCLGGDDAEPPALTAGLIPYRNVVARQRQKGLPALGTPAGAAGAFTALLAALPALRQGLDAMIEARLRDDRYAQRLSPWAFFGEFKRLLAELHWPADRYPYTSASCGYESVRLYFHQRVAELSQARQRRRQRATRRVITTDPRFRAQRITQLDEHVLDLSTGIRLLLDDQLIALRVARANALVAVDRDTTCVLGYYLAPTRHPNQQDLLTLLDRCVAPWAPRVLTTPGLAYTPGAAFPSAGAEAFPIGFGTVQLDNAYMHYAQSVIALLSDHFGATLSYGPPATPTVRNRVEHIFDVIAETCTQRVAATTGTDPKDPQRESRKNRRQPPAITFQMLDEALSVVLTHYNVQPQAALGGVAPLALYREQCAQHYVPYTPQLLAREWRPFTSTEVHALKWNRVEQRQPHVNFYGARYQGAGLLRVAGREREIRVRFDRRDIRTLQAETLTGIDLGELQVTEAWRRYPHSLATRQTILRDTRQRRQNAHDPLGGYFAALLEHRDESSQAQQLLRVYHEFSDGSGSGLTLDLPTPESRTPPSRYRWRAAHSTHRR